jgi:hypothetical protein
MGRSVVDSPSVALTGKVGFMSSTPTARSTLQPAPARAPRWMAARPETRVGIDFDDQGFRLAAIRLVSHCTSLDAPELSVEWLHRVSESAPDIKSNVAAYLDVLAARLPRSATRSGVAISIAMPPAVQSLRCVHNTQLAEAERGIADELGGAVQSRSWPVGSQKSMICAVRRDVAESLLEILGKLGYRCESILPRSIALARTQLTASPNRENNATILCWGRQRSLVTLISDRTIRMCREFVTHESTQLGLKPEAESDGDETSSQHGLSKVAGEVVHELGMTLQHASRLDDRTNWGPIILCGTMSAHAQAVESLRAALDMSQGGDLRSWKLGSATRPTAAPLSEVDQANAVAASLAIGGSKVAIDNLQIGSKSR